MNKFYKQLDYITDIEKDRTLTEAVKKKLINDSQGCMIFNTVDEMFDFLDAEYEEEGII